MRQTGHSLLFAETIKDTRGFETCDPVIPSQELRPAPRGGRHPDRPDERADETIRQAGPRERCVRYNIGVSGDARFERTGNQTSSNVPATVISDNDRVS